jgi:hypothetical protein
MPGLSVMARVLTADKALAIALLLILGAVAATQQEGRTRSPLERLLTSALTSSTIPTNPCPRIFPGTMFMRPR